MRRTTSAPSSLSISPTTAELMAPLLALMSRFQRAPEGTRQSPACCGDQVVDRGGLRWIRVRGYPLMLCDRTVHTEGDRPVFARQPRMTDRTAEALDPNFRAVDNITHSHLSLSVAPCLHE